MGNRKIFIQIASYRDPQLIITIKDAIKNAKNPNNLVFGICRQYHPDDKFDSLDEFDDFLPEEFRNQFGFPNLHEAYKEVHRPTSIEQAESARKRLTFDEAFLLQLALLKQKNELSNIHTIARIPKTPGVLSEFDKQLPFQLTPGQLNVSSEIFQDLIAEHPMHRLLQGEVGSGKTIVALRAALSVIDASAQVALLAPTEVLAQQHFRTITKQLGELATKGKLGAPDNAIAIALLTGSLSASEKKEIHAKIQSGEIDLAIGTHALLSDAVSFKDLGLVIVDEQHRFGVEQRDALRAKAVTPPHLLVMTATPIPRTVAITVFGDLDISTLSELPLGRTPITTHLVNEVTKPKYLERAWQRIREEVAEGHQAYVVAPRISAGTPEDSDMDFLFGNESKEMSAVTELAPELATGVLKGLRIAELHGKQSADEKEETMQAFSNKEIDVLVSTTVIEVGVDVPNATVMVIMDADRFGVSQLHQLRGRVGRGSRRGQAPRFDDGGTALAHGGQEHGFIPHLVVDQGLDRLAADGGEPVVGVHGGRVVAPDTQFFDVGHGLAGFGSDLAGRTVLV